jgi:hypothetical protein
MMRMGGAAAALIGACAALTPFVAQAATRSSDAGGPAVGTELWASTDSDHTDVVKLLARALWSFERPDQYQGIAVERAWFKPQGQHVRTQSRAYLDLAGDAGAKWRWRARIGTNGHTILGSAGFRSADWSKELFVEREIVETPLGLDKGLYYTFAGASMDLPAGERDRFNAMAGLQEFTGRNVRLHLRGTYVHVASPKLGLSLQLRTRYFHSSVPHEFDYYSPRDFFQAVPVVQMRRFDRSGWMYLAALGYGAQKATGSNWQAARLADFRIESPPRSRKLQAFVQIQYSNNSLSAGGGGYHYVLGRLGLTARLN